MTDLRFKQWFEMAMFSVPSGLRIKVPCDLPEDCEVTGIDMRFEDSPPVLDKNGRVMNQGSNFYAKLPSGGYFSYGEFGNEIKMRSQSDIKELEKSGYEPIPNDWWKRAQLLDSEGNVINT